MNEYAMPTNDRQPVVFILLAAFGIRVIADLADTDGVDAEKAIRAIFAQNLPGWVVVVGGLVFLSEFESTSDIARAFALLILIATALQNALPALAVATKAIEDWWLDWGNGAEKKETSK